jgi:hypothetical protein
MRAKVVGTAAGGESPVSKLAKDKRKRRDIIAGIIAFEPSRSDGIRAGLYDFDLTRFLDANRYPLRSKTL